MFTKNANKIEDCLLYFYTTGKDVDNNFFKKMLRIAFTKIRLNLPSRVRTTLSEWCWDSG